MWWELKKRPSCVAQESRFRTQKGVCSGQKVRPRYNAGQVWEVDRIMKELPEDLEAHKSREWVIMDLEKACVFLGVDFRKGSFLGGK